MNLLFKSAGGWTVYTVGKRSLLWQAGGALFGLLLAALRLLFRDVGDWNARWTDMECETDGNKIITRVAITQPVRQGGGTGPLGRPRPLAVADGSF
jgi:hypothetical protein